MEEGEDLRDVWRVCELGWIKGSGRVDVPKWVAWVIVGVRWELWEADIADSEYCPNDY